MLTYPPLLEQIATAAAVPKNVIARNVVTKQSQGFAVGAFLQVRPKERADGPEGPSLQKIAAPFGLAMTRGKRRPLNDIFGHIAMIVLE